MDNTKAFEEFDKDNPQVWKLFVKLVIKHLNAGHRKGSVEFIFNIMRWEHDMQTTDPFYKINNNHKPFYARKWMKFCTEQSDPKWLKVKDYFSIRESKADNLFKQQEQ